MLDDIDGGGVWDECIGWVLLYEVTAAERKIYIYTLFVLLSIEVASYIFGDG